MPRLMSVEDRFWRKVSIRTPSERWEWNACTSPDGYGWFKHRGRNTNAHRVAYELEVGPIPDGLVVRHACDNRRCVNPSHLSLGTNQDKVDDKMSRGRHPNLLMTCCRRGHPFDEANTYIHPKTGKRCCRACNRRRQAELAARRKEAERA